MSTTDVEYLDDQQDTLPQPRVRQAPITGYGKFTLFLIDKGIVKTPEQASQLLLIVALAFFTLSAFITFMTLQQQAAKPQPYLYTNQQSVLDASQKPPQVKSVSYPPK